MASKRRYSTEQREAFFTLHEQGKGSREIARLCSEGKAPAPEGSKAATLPAFDASDRSIRQVLLAMRQARDVAARPKTIQGIHVSAANVLHAQLRQYEEKLERGEELSPTQIKNAANILSVKAAPTRGKLTSAAKTDKPSGPKPTSPLEQLAKAAGQERSGNTQAKPSEESEERNEQGERPGQSSEHASTPASQAD